MIVNIQAKHIFERNWSLHTLELGWQLSFEILSVEGKLEHENSILLSNLAWRFAEIPGGHWVGAVPIGRLKDPTQYNLVTAREKKQKTHNEGA